MRIKDYLDLDSEKEAKLRAVATFSPERPLLRMRDEDRFSPFEKAVIKSIEPQAERLSKGEAPYPAVAQVRISHACGHSCPGCLYGSQQTAARAFFDSNRFSQLFKGLLSLMVKLVDLSGGGEPTLHPEFDAFARHCIQKQLKVSLLTNASSLEAEISGLLVEGFSLMRIKLDASNDKVYHRIHRHSHSGEFDRVLRNTERLISLRERRKSNLIVGAEARLNQTNMNFMEEMAALGKDLGLDYIQFRRRTGGSECLLPEQVKRVERLTEELRCSHHPFGVYGEIGDHQINRGCWSSSLTLTVDASGEAYACRHFSENTKVAPFGNLFKENAPTLWFGLPHKRAVEFLQARDCGVQDCRWRFKPDFPESRRWQGNGRHAETSS